MKKLNSDLSRICAKHFIVIYLNYPYQFSENKRIEITKSENELKIARLKLSATPLIFSNLPKYMSNKPLLNVLIQAPLYTNAKKELFAAETKK